jgi:hypothetical protein
VKVFSPATVHVNVPVDVVEVVKVQSELLGTHVTEVAEVE